MGFEKKTPFLSLYHKGDDLGNSKERMVL